MHTGECSKYVIKSLKCDALYIAVTPMMILNAVFNLKSWPRQKQAKDSGTFGISLPQQILIALFCQFNAVTGGMRL